MRLLVAIPAYNEAATVGEVVRRVREDLPDATVLVVDDGSHDGTKVLARDAGAQVLELPFNVGVGGAMRTAFVFARDRGFDVLVQVDADGQHLPSEVPRLVAALSDSSVVVGSRFSKTSDYEVRGPRMWAMKLLSVVVSRFTRSQLTDTTSGFRAADRKAIDLFARHYPVEYLGDTVESLVIASRSGLTVTQVEVRMRPRQGGSPSQNPLRSFLYLGRAMLALFVALVSRPSIDSAP